MILIHKDNKKRGKIMIINRMKTGLEMGVNFEMLVLLLVQIFLEGKMSVLKNPSNLLIRRVCADEGTRTHTPHGTRS